MLGTIFKVLPRGFGFIKVRGDASAPNVFFNARDLRGGLEFGQQLLERDVEFETLETSKGLNARNVRPAD